MNINHDGLIVSLALTRMHEIATEVAKLRSQLNDGTEVFLGVPTPEEEIEKLFPVWMALAEIVYARDQRLPMRTRADFDRITAF